MRTHGTRRPGSSSHRPWSDRARPPKKARADSGPDATSGPGTGGDPSWTPRCWTCGDTGAGAAPESVCPDCPPPVVVSEDERAVRVALGVPDGQPLFVGVPRHVMPREEDAL